MNKQIKTLIILSLMLSAAAIYKISSGSSQLPENKSIDKTPEFISSDAQQPPRSAPVASPLPSARAKQSNITEESTPQITAAKDLPNYYEGLPPIEDAASDYEFLDDQSVTTQLEAITQKLAANKWFERANEGDLSTAERRELASILHMESALRLSRILRKLNQVEDEVL